nr:MAG TPA: hypothetical protein [Crassvirales sp.]
MVQFNELHITPDGKTLVIDVSVKDLAYYENVYLDSIQIETQKTFSSGESDYIKTIEKDGVKHIRLELGTGDLLPSLTDNLFFVYVSTKGTPAADTPCGMDNITTVGAVFYPYNIYCNLLKTLKLEGTYTCDIPKTFLNEFFKYKGLQFSLLTGDYMSAIKYFKSISDKVQVTETILKCSCHGS